MKPDRWQKVKDIFDAALELAPEKRGEFLDKNCEEDKLLRREVENLLASFKDDSFMEQPAAAEVASVIFKGEAKNLEAGKCFGHYEIVRQIGAGGMGEVYLARDKKLDRKVAVKILNENFARDESNLNRFIREAKAASALNHPNILVIHEIDECDDTHYIVSEFIEGVTLRDRFKKSPMKLAEVLDIAIQIANALCTAHASGIVHRDIKPENIIVRPDGFVKILDFGLAKLVERKVVGFEDVTVKQNQTAKGVILGTINYMSPEQAEGERVDERTDIFSFGATVYEMMTGKTPFAGDSVSETFANLINSKPQPLSHFVVDAPTDLQRIVAKMLRKNKDERYQTMKGLLADLKDLRETLAFDERLEKSHPPGAENATKILQATTGEAQFQTTASDYSFLRQIKNHKRASLVGILIFSLAAIGFGYWFFGNQNTKQIESIAVLPFVNESRDADAEYLSDGMTESLISSLSQLPSLSVKARSSVFRYKGKEIDPKKIGQELSVQAVLLGHVIQRGEQLVLNLELIDAKTENIIWSEQYTRKQTNFVSLQTEIARDVSSKLRMRLSGAEQQKLRKNYTENSEAYRFYLKGRYYWYKFPAKDYEKSRDYYQQAIDVDPNYALAYAGLAEYYGFGAANGFLPANNENWSKSAAAANKALALDDMLPDAYNARAGVKQFHNDMAGAERDLERAIELNPKYAEGYSHYAHLLTGIERFEEAIAQMQKALELEPFNVLFNRQLGWIFYRAREYDRAIGQYRKTLELDPNDAPTRESLGDAYEQKGMQKEAVAEWSRALTLTGDNELAMMLERTFAAAGFNAAVRALWQKKLEQFNEKAERGEYVPAMNYAYAYTRLTDKEQAFAWLAKAEQERNSLIFDVKLDPIYGIWRDDSRFQDLLKRVDMSQ